MKTDIIGLFEKTEQLKVGEVRHLKISTLMGEVTVLASRSQDMIHLMIAKQDPLNPCHVYWGLELWKDAINTRVKF